MIIKRKDMLKENRSDLKGGTGEISFINLNCSNEKNCRLMSEMTIPVSASIGIHEHKNETEYYIILDGTGRASDNGTQHTVEAGDIVITKGGETHMLENIGNIPLKLIAVIITY